MKIEIDIPARRIADLMVSAIEQNHMTRAWCDGVYLKTVNGSSIAADERINGEKIWYDDESLFDGTCSFLIEVIEITDEDLDAPEGRVARTLTPEKIATGFKLMAEKHGCHFGDFLAEKDDNVTSDVWLQCCVLSDVVYG